MCTQTAVGLAKFRKDLISHEPFASFAQFVVGIGCEGCAAVFVLQVSKGGARRTACADNSVRAVRRQERVQLAHAGAICHQCLVQRSLALLGSQKGLGFHLAWLRFVDSAQRIRPCDVIARDRSQVLGLLAAICGLCLAGQIPSVITLCHQLKELVGVATTTSSGSLHRQGWVHQVKKGCNLS